MSPKCNQEVDWNEHHLPEEEEEEQEQDDNLETNENQTNQNEDLSLNIVQLKSQSKNKDNNLLVNSREKEMNLEFELSRDTKQKQIIQIENKKQSLFDKRNSYENPKLPSKNIDDLEESHDQSNSFAYNNESVLNHNKNNVDNNAFSYVYYISIDKNNITYFTIIY